MVKGLRSYENSVLCVAGNPLIFSYAKKIMERLDKDEYIVLPSPSSVIYLCAKHKIWVNDMNLVSGHNSVDLETPHTLTIKYLNENKPVGYFVKNLTDYESLMNRLKDINCEVYAGYELGTTNEKLYKFKPENHEKIEKGRLILFIKPLEHGFMNKFPKNENLNTEDIPVSRDWSRALIINDLNLKTGDIVLDLGAGSGASSIWMAECIGHTGKVYSYETKENRFEKLVKNTNLYPNVIPLNDDYINHDFNIMPNKIHFGGGIEKERIGYIFDKVNPGTEFIAALATIESVNIFKSIKGIDYKVDMYSKHIHRSLGDKIGFMGDHLFFIVKGVKK